LVLIWHISPNLVRWFLVYINTLLTRQCRALSTLQWLVVHVFRARKRNVFP
jgi:hypothetical protein